MKISYHCISCKKNSIWNLQELMLNLLSTKSLKRNWDLDLGSKRSREGNYSVAFFFAASILSPLATYSSIPSSLATDAASD